LGCRERNADGSWVRRGTSDAAAHHESLRDYPPLIKALASHSVRYVVDAGANDGFSTALFARALPDASVVAIEPSAGNYAMCVLNTRELPRVTVLRAALWSEMRELRVSEARAGAREEWGLRTKPPAEARAGASTAVPGVELGELIGALRFPRVDFLKLDIEGAEFDLLRGGGGGWLPRVRFLFLEAHPHFLGREAAHRGRGHHLLRASLGALLGANMTVAAMPNLQFSHLRGFHEWIYLACGAPLPADECLAVCRAWHARTRVQCDRVERATDYWGARARGAVQRPLKVWSAKDVGRTDQMT
jgi:FkbM family methyltransferase